MLGFILFGAGRIGRLHAANIHAHRAARLRCICDPDLAAARELGERFGVAATASVDEALAVTDVDAVLIASPTGTHVDLIAVAASAGKAIFCEKPIDLDSAQVERCGDLLKAHPVPVQIGFNRRYDPGHRALREALLAGEIGRLEFVHITSRDSAPPPMPYLRTSGGLFRDMTIHDFDMARFLLGEEPVTVSAMASVLVDPQIGRAGDVDTAAVTLRTASGVLCQIGNSRRAVYGYDQRIEVLGATGMLQSANPHPTSLRRHSAAATSAREPLCNFFLERYAQSYRLELDDFIGAVEDGRPPAVSFEDGRRALLLAEAAQRSLATGRSVTIDANRSAT
jgi:myo-inositol 2-dehydrogenase/D-chiro-inositol 1-dehydrogenase